MSAWLMTIALGLAIVGCSNTKITTNTTTIVATDDGLNVRGLIDDSTSDAEKEAYGEENQADTYLKITGGVVNVDAKTL